MADGKDRQGTHTSETGQRHRKPRNSFWYKPRRFANRPALAKTKPTRPAGFGFAGPLKITCRLRASTSLGGFERNVCELLTAQGKGPPGMQAETPHPSNIVTPESKGGSYYKDLVWSYV